MIRTVAVIAALALLLALAPWPYDYYRLLRVVTFAAGVYCGVSMLQENRSAAIGLFVCAAVFNPFIPAYLTREIWSVLNIAGAGLFAFTAYASRKLAE
ncbi:hypothetical protein GOL22_14080 [Sinorhizobium medicae]|nr:hypothetical protein [Sinorhizobium medicae]